MISTSTLTLEGRKDVSEMNLLGVVILPFYSYEIQMAFKQSLVDLYPGGGCD